MKFRAIYLYFRTFQSEPRGNESVLGLTHEEICKRREESVDGCALRVSRIGRWRVQVWGVGCGVWVWMDVWLDVHERVSCRTARVVG